MQEPALSLTPIDQRNWRAALAVQVADDQLRFVAAHQPVALVILAKAFLRLRDLDWEPLAVGEGDSIVAVVALAHASAHTEVFHLAVDAARQGHGVGSATVRLLVAHVTRSRPNAQHLRLSVHPENAAARRLYQRHGFSPTGELRDGEPVWSLEIPPRDLRASWGE